VNADTLLACLSENETEFAAAEREINKEMVRLLEHDAVKYPVHGSKVAGGDPIPLEALPDDLVVDARHAINRELAVMLGLPQSQLNAASLPHIEQFDEVWSKVHSNDVNDTNLLAHMKDVHEVRLLHGFLYQHSC
jgi:hypothetical protein